MNIFIGRNTHNLIYKIGPQKLLQVQGDFFYTQLSALISRNFQNDTNNLHTNQSLTERLVCNSNLQDHFQDKVNLEKQQ